MPAAFSQFEVPLGHSNWGPGRLEDVPATVGLDPAIIQLIYHELSCDLPARPHDSAVRLDGPWVRFGEPPQALDGHGIGLSFQLLRLHHDAIQVEDKRSYHQTPPMK